MVGNQRKFLFWHGTKIQRNLATVKLCNTFEGNKNRKVNACRTVYGAKEAAERMRDHECVRETHNLSQ